jgi:hypothetical protein
MTTSGRVSSSASTGGEAKARRHPPCRHLRVPHRLAGQQ